MNNPNECCGKCGGEMPGECYCAHVTTCTCRPDKEYELFDELAEGAKRYVFLDPAATAGDETVSQYASRALGGFSLKIREQLDKHWLPRSRIVEELKKISWEDMKCGCNMCYAHEKTIEQLASRLGLEI